jgi:starch synthase (maltosyl-transferring)
LDYANPQSGWVDLDLVSLELDPDRPFVVHDQLTDAHYQWHGSRNFILLDPVDLPAHVFIVTQAAAP